MGENSLKSKVITSLIWKLLERSGTLGIQFIVLIILARLLSPEDYGMISLASIFIFIANVFIQGGFTTSLIQKKSADESDFSSVFYISLMVSILMYGILYFLAPMISDLLNYPHFKSIIRVLAVTLFFGAFNTIQSVLIARNMQFKKLFFSSLGAIFVSGLLGIALAYYGYGVWALVVQQITNQLLITLILWLTVKWRPKFVFSLIKLQDLFSFGWKLLISELIDTIYLHIRSLIIGLIFSPTMLGYYNKGKQFPSFIVTNINGSIQSVMLPVLSSQQENKKKIKAMVRRSIVTSSFIVFPMMVGLAIISETLIKVLLTDKWLPAVPFLVIYCASYALWPLNTANLQAINALGRSDIFLKLEILKKVISIIILIITLFYNAYTIALGALLSGIISSFINAYPNKRLLDYSYREQIKDVVPSILNSLAMGAIVYSLKLLTLLDIHILLLQIFIGFISYITFAKIFKLECYIYLVDISKDIIKVMKFRIINSISILKREG